MSDNDTNLGGRQNARRRSRRNRSFAAANDSLRWTSVPGAELYRVQVWDREGNIVLAQDARDTTLARPGTDQPCRRVISLGSNSQDRVGPLGLVGSPGADGSRSFHSLTQG